jgi:DNA-binding MarR family transcriptional regulator
MSGVRLTVKVRSAQAFLGVSRFDDLRRRLGISRKVLAERLKELVAEGFLERRQYRHRPARYEYTLTAKRRELLPVIEAMRTDDRGVSRSCCCAFRTSLRSFGSVGCVPFLDAFLCAEVFLLDGDDVLSSAVDRGDELVQLDQRRARLAALGKAQ